ncbi:MAG: carboxypeptidase regulatory-like domain-containing protein [Gemmatimonadales bacterium]
MFPNKSPFLAAFVAIIPTFAASAQQAPAAGGGVIEGVVAVEPIPARRTANRYPGGAAEAHPVQALPAIAYLVGAVPGAASAADARAVMSQRDTAFVPAVVAVRAGGTVAFPNGDQFFHNVFSYSSAQRFDLGRYPQGESKEVTFRQPGIVEVFCEVHEFMRGAILVAESPFHAMVGDDNRFRLSGVPPGTYTLAVWHPDHQPVEQRVEVRAGEVSRVEISLRR